MKDLRKGFESNKALPLALAVLLGAVVACSSSIQVGETTADENSIVETGQEKRPDLVSLQKGPVSADGLQAILATIDLGLGVNRFGFVLVSSEGIVRNPTVKVSTFMVERNGETEDEVQSTMAVFRPWPYGTRGLYTTQLRFDETGNWGVSIEMSGSSGSVRQARLLFEVNETTVAPAVGDPVVKSKNRTIRDVDSLSELTTGSLQDPDLYQNTVAKAVESGLPTVVVMASPAFCTNAVCGPQVEVLQQLKDAYRGLANFIHIDFYDNPEEIQGDLSKARLSKTVLEWNLPSTEWSFVISRDGVIVARFEAFATLRELEEALRPLL